MGESNVGAEPGSPHTTNSDLALVAVALASLGLILWFTPWSAVTPLFVGIAAVLALMGIVLPGRSRRWSVVGLGVSAIAGALAAAPVVSWSSPDSEAVASAGDQRSSVARNEDGPPDAQLAATDATTIVYRVVTDGLSVTHLSYVDFENGTTVMRESLGVPPPFEYVVTIPREELVNLDDFSVTGMGGASSANVRCSISVDGRVVSRQSATGAYGLVNCMGSKESSLG